MERVKCVSRRNADRDVDSETSIEEAASRDQIRDYDQAKRGKNRLRRETH